MVRPVDGFVNERLIAFAVGFEGGSDGGVDLDGVGDWGGF